MRIAWLDCSMGISGDMALGALIDAGADVDVIRAGIDSLKLPDVRLRTETVLKGAFRAIKIHVEHPPQHAQRWRAPDRAQGPERSASRAVTAT